MEVLNIPVPPLLAGRWRGWLAPARQPFFLTHADAARLGLDAAPLETVPRASVVLTPEDRDTFTEWNVAAHADRVAWLTVDDVDARPPGVRRALLHGQVRVGRGNVPLGRHFADRQPSVPAGRFLWRREHLTDAVLAQVVSQEGRPCQRAHVPARVWDGAAPLLPFARSLAGTFPVGSAGNCFGTVMGAAGVPGAADEWMQREPFETFLRERTVPGGLNGRAGTVLVWRSADTVVQHAAVTLGGGWALHKPAQTWWTPRVVLPLGTLKAASRTPGWHLERRSLARHR